MYNIFENENNGNEMMRYCKYKYSIFLKRDIYNCYIYFIYIYVCIYNVGGYLYEII